MIEKQIHSLCALVLFLGNQSVLVDELLFAQLASHQLFNQSRLRHLVVTECPVLFLQVGNFIVHFRRQGFQDGVEVVDGRRLGLVVGGDGLAGVLKGRHVLAGLEADQEGLEGRVLPDPLLLVSRNLFAVASNLELVLRALVLGDGKVESDVDNGEEEEGEECGDEKEGFSDLSMELLANLNSS